MQVPFFPPDPMTTFDAYKDQYFYAFERNRHGQKYTINYHWELLSMKFEGDILFPEAKSFILFDRPFVVVDFAAYEDRHQNVVWKRAGLICPN